MDLLWHPTPRRMGDMSRRLGHCPSGLWTPPFGPTARKMGQYGRRMPPSGQAVYGDAAEARQVAAEALKLAPASKGAESEAALAFAMGGDTVRAESLAQDLDKRFPLDTQMQSLWLPAIRAQLALDRKNPTAALNTLRAASSIELGEIRSSRTFPASIRCMCAERHTWQPDRAALPPPSFRRSRPQRDRLELLDGSVGAFGSGSGQCLAVENLARSGSRCRPCSGARRLQRFPHPLERRRPRHPYPERSQSRVREAAMSARNC